MTFQVRLVAAGDRLSGLDGGNRCAVPALSAADLGLDLAALTLQYPARLVVILTALGGGALHVGHFGKLSKTSWRQTNTT